MEINSLRQILAGKTLGRVLFNERVGVHCAALQGSVIDLGGGAAPGYLRYLSRDASYTRTDVQASAGVLPVDLNKPLPFSNESFDAALLFNSLYILEDQHMSLREIHRILKKEGRLFLSSPFIASEIPEPRDYMRFTAEGLERLLVEACFEVETLERMGGRVSAAVNLLHPLFLFSLIRVPVYACALALDRLIAWTGKDRYATPIGYFVVAKKQ